MVLVPTTTTRTPIVPQELQAAVQVFEGVQSAIREAEESNKEVEQQARTEQEQATQEMEECLAKRAALSAEFAEAKAKAEQSRRLALLVAVQRSRTSPGPPELEPAPARPSSRPLLDLDDDEAGTDGGAAGKRPDAAARRYEPVTSSHADLVIRIPGSLDAVGIKVEASGLITKAPGNLFDPDFTVLGIDGKKFVAGMEKLEGTKNVVVRCRKAEVVQSMSRVPYMQLMGKTLKMLQVQIRPGADGFGIDLSEFNGVASIIEDGAAAKSDLRRGDIVIAADGVYTGGRRLVDTIQKGRSSYVFTVVRATAPTIQDKIDTEDDASDAADVAAAPTVSATATAPGHAPDNRGEVDEESAKVDADLRKSLAASLGRLQEQNSILERESQPSVRFVRVEPNGESAITVEWEEATEVEASLYNLQWRLEGESQWEETEASSSLEAAVVTKGNLEPQGVYRFRVRGRGAETGQWGPWSKLTQRTRPDGVEVEVEGEDDASETDAPVDASEEAAAAVAEEKVAMDMDAVQGVLNDQRKSIEERHALEVAALEARLKAELTAAHQERDDWKAQFMEAAGTSMQAVVDAKDETRKEVEEEFKEEKAEVEKMKAEAADAIAKIKAAEDVAEAARQESEHFKKRFFDAKAEAKADTDREAEAKLQVVMRNAALEMRDKVKFVEGQIDVTVQRAVEDTKRKLEAKAESEKRAATRELELAHQRQLQEMRNRIGAGAQERIASAEARQESNIQKAVAAALRGAEDAAAKAQATAVQTAMNSASLETEQRMRVRHTALEQQMAKLQKELDTLRANSRNEASVQEMVTSARDERRRAIDDAVRAAREEAEQKAARQLNQMAEAVGEKIKEAVAAREKEIIADQQQALVEASTVELRDQEQLVRTAGMAASQKWGSGNDDFEEAALSRTNPVRQMAPQPAAPQAPAAPQPAARQAPAAPQPAARQAPAAPPPAAPQDQLEALEGVGENQPMAQRPKASRTREAPGRKQAVKPRPPAPEESPEANGLRARHDAEVAALLARQKADALRGMDSAGAAADDEKEALRKRQLEEALAHGAALAYEERAKDGILPNPSEETILALAAPPTNEAETSKLAAKHPKVKKALDRMHRVERKLAAPQAELEGAAEKSEDENQRASELISSMLTSRENGEANREVTEEERAGLISALAVLQTRQDEGDAMKAMLREITPADASAEETASCVAIELERDDEAKGTLASQLKRLVAREQEGTLADGELELLNKLNLELKRQQEQSQVREAHIDWLKAEARRSRVMQLLEARADLERLQRDVVAAEADEGLTLPTTPVVVGAVSTSEDDRHLIFENDACAAALCMCASFASMAFLLSRWASCFSLCTCSWCIALAAASVL